MSRLLQEATLDEKFNNEMRKIQGAIDNLQVILDQMKDPSAMSKPTPIQRMQLRYAAEDLKKLHEKSQ